MKAALRGILYAHLAVGYSLLFAPLVLLLVLGPPPYYEGRRFTIMPPYGEVLTSGSRSRERAADAIVERMVVRKWSIAARNWFTYQVLGYVDTPEVVSGGSGYLFTRKGFDRFKCGAADVSNEELTHFVRAIGLARGAGVNVVLAVPPNKASIHPHALTGRAAHRSRCYLERTEQQWLALQENLGEALVDHRSTVLAIKRRSGEGYFYGDTHWMPHMALAIAHDLRLAFTGVDVHLDDLPVEYSSHQAAPDLERRLLITRSMPKMRAKPRYLNRALAALDPIPGKTLVLHDSFYKSNKKLISRLFEDVTYFHLDKVGFALRAHAPPDSDFHRAIRTADNIVVEVVERDVRNRLAKLSEFLANEMGRRSGLTSGGESESAPASQPARTTGG